MAWLSAALEGRSSQAANGNGHGNGHVAAPAGAVGVATGNGAVDAAARAQWSGVLKQAEAGAVGYYVVVGFKA